jgi:hypothetical protein
MIQNGTYTIENTETGDYRTFKIKTVLDGDLEGKRIVSLLTGSDNQNDYKGFAFLFDHGIVVWKKYRGTNFEHLARMLWAALNDALPERYDILHEGTCIRCNRPLTCPESIRTGIGPVCAGRE